MNFTPIGTYHSDAKAPYEAARQPLERVRTRGEVILQPGQQFEQALEDLEGFERIWLIYVFHHNPHWKPKVLPPRGSDRKVGVFATRAPYRPNPLGMSCVKLVSIQGLRLTVEGADLLDGTPVLDIKPYLPYADSFPDARTGWVSQGTQYQVQFSMNALDQVIFLREQGLSQLENFIFNQLEHDPTNKNKKRVAPLETDFVLAYKTWRIRFHVEENPATVTVLEIFSGYSPSEMELSEDPYQDKKIHLAFCSAFCRTFGAPS